MAIQLLKHRLESYNVRIQHERSEYLPEIKADPEQLKEVLVNVIVNACEAMRDGGQIVVSEAELQTTSVGRAALIRLKDNGPGIPKTIKEKVFQPFFTTKEEGTGLGLSIAERIINEHGGRIHLETEEDIGTTVEIVLPVEEEYGEQRNDYR